MATPKFVGHIIHERIAAEAAASITGETVRGTAVVAAQLISYSMNEYNRSAQAGEKLAVTLTDSGKIVLAGNGDAIHGRLESVEADLMCTVAYRFSRLKFLVGQKADGSALDADTGAPAEGRGIVGSTRGAGTDASPTTYGYVRSPVAEATPIVADADTATAINEATRARGSVNRIDGSNPIVSVP